LTKKTSPLRIYIVTLFPKFINDFADNFGILKKAMVNKLLNITAVDLRQFGLGERQIVDDRPYGGGVGMVLRPDVLYKAVEAAKKLQILCLRHIFTTNSKFQTKSKSKNTPRVILLTPQGKKFNQKEAHRLSQYNNLIFVCGRYEGFDERIRGFVDEELSIGDYVLMGGELPALVISEAVMRLRPGILGKLESTENESFSESMLEYPQYTKPEEWRLKVKGKKDKVLSVPKVLRSGHHANIETWRSDESHKRTKKRRPDLFANVNITNQK